MAERVNAQIADALTERLVRVGRLTTRIRLDVWRQLVALEADILALLKMADPTDLPFLRARLREVERLMHDDLGPLILARYRGLAALVTETLIPLALQEVVVMQRLVNDATGKDMLPELPSDTALRRGVTETLFPTPQRSTDLSTTGADWWTRLGANFRQRLGDSLKVGVSLEETLTQLTARVKGTPDNGFEDGLMAKARTDAATVVQTQVTNAVSEAHVALGQRNASPALMAVHSSILDTRTSLVCLSRHGLRYAIPGYEGINHSIPYLSGTPYHINCRSTILIVPRDGGPIPDASVTAWLQRHDTAYQDAVLGPTRARMFRRGDLSPRQLLEAATGRPLTLEELGA